MGLFDQLMGNSSEQNPEDVQAEFDEYLLDDEIVEKSYILLRDLFVFTNKRILVIDKQGFSGKKIEFITIPYKNIRAFSVENAGTFDVEAELKLYVAGMPAPLLKTFDKNTNIKGLQQTISKHVL
ncbi:PH domain-containing protein [Abyssicoccus albus]|uniref:PH (Pleckstrin Homology) domain-containing protein n=1 Tax=Abyssicoccus albus TaxID=1817405 RepID=A0A3N5BTG4_9BACL|nr:PH domain-containing protein [Abyssicoccus albus]RPF58360.1 PH (Pleckstrin Homology) domain-containing protein [Abyssicoccus albus]